MTLIHSRTRENHTFTDFMNVDNARVPCILFAQGRS